MDLSVLIPARNEMFLARTVEDVLEHAEADTEVVVVLDGAWADPPVRDDPRVTLIYHPRSVGQRAATNEAARVARGRYVMKLDAHCAVDQGFDRKMLAAMQPGYTMVPVMRNLHVFDWLCRDCGHRRYQGHSGPCEECGGPTERDVVWVAKHNPQSTSYCFDPEPHFQYFREFKKRPEGKPGPDGLTETMSLQGSCFLMERERYFALDACDERFGTWGSQGIEVACKSWLSGGRVVCCWDTWYAHAFRTKGGDWGFPYPLSGKQVRRAKRRARDLFFNDAWPQQVRPLSWLLERFWPVRGWTEEDLAALKHGDPLGDADGDVDALEEADAEALSESDSASGSESDSHIFIQSPGKAILYYTDNRLDETILRACQNQLLKAGLPVVSVSLGPLDFGRNVVVDGERGPETMFRQILAGLEVIDADVVFFAEHDVLYHPGHFEFSPGQEDLFYYNNNLWKVDAGTGRALFHYSNHTSQLCAHRPFLLGHYRKRVAMVGQNGFSRRMGFEPGTHGRKERVDDHKCDTWMSPEPNLDLRHGGNFTQTRWRREQFRNQRFTKGWQEADRVPPWYGPGGLAALLAELSSS